MKISDVQAHLLAIPMKETDIPSAWVSRDFHQMIVEIKTDEGVTGYGDLEKLKTAALHAHRAG